MPESLHADRGRYAWLHRAGSAGLVAASNQSVSREARLPGSKAITTQALVLAAAATGTTRLQRPLISDDTDTLRRALEQLGVTLATDADTWTVTGLGGGPQQKAKTTQIWCQNADAVAWLLPPLAAAGTGTYAFDGSPQLRAKPLGPLLAALRRLGTTIDATRLPFTLDSHGLSSTSLTLPNGASDKTLTGLLLSAPLIPQGLRVTALQLINRPSVDVTIHLLRLFGATVDDLGSGQFSVAGTGLHGQDLLVEPDATIASNFVAAAAITGTTLIVPGLSLASHQREVRFLDVLRQLGAISVDADDSSITVTGTGGLTGGPVAGGDSGDTFMTLAAIAPLADTPLRIEGIRLGHRNGAQAAATNLRVCGIDVEEGPDWLIIRPGLPRPARIQCHDDYRIAMAFTVLGLRTDGLQLDDSVGSDGESFPSFRDELGRLFAPM